MGAAPAAGFGMAPMAQAAGPQVTEQMELPHKMIGRVIGKGGSGLKLIREASGSVGDRGRW